MGDMKCSHSTQLASLNGTLHFHLIKIFLPWHLYLYNIQGVCGGVLRITLLSNITKYEAILNKVHFLFLVPTHMGFISSMKILHYRYSLFLEIAPINPHCKGITHNENTYVLIAHGQRLLCRLYADVPLA